MTIEFFSGEYRFLSNFYPAVVALNDIPFPTVEHAYQAAKSSDPDLMTDCLAMTAGEAKRWGRLLPIRSDWEEIKVPVMRKLLQQKFAAGTQLASRLVATNPEDLIEGNTWGDKFWGVCNGEGLNHLGKLLEEVRFDLIYVGV